jgi:hypothetical protein
MADTTSIRHGIALRGCAYAVLASISQKKPRRAWSRKARSTWQMQQVRGYFDCTRVPWKRCLACHHCCIESAPIDWLDSCWCADCGAQGPSYSRPVGCILLQHARSLACCVRGLGKSKGGLLSAQHVQPCVCGAWGLEVVAVALAEHKSMIFTPGSKKIQPCSVELLTARPQP